jgi:hypothetical protein
MDFHETWHEGHATKAIFSILEFSTNNNSKMEAVRISEVLILTQFNEIFLKFSVVH